MKKVVVTGGAGFIGSHIVEALIAEDCHVVVVDDLSSGRMDNIAELLESVEFIGGSVTDFSLLKKAFQGADCVFHLAAIPGVQQSVTDPIRSNEVNVSGTVNVLRAASENLVRKIVFSSSSAVYGDGGAVRAQEDMMPQPLSPYAVAKLAGEYYCKAFSHISRIQTVSLRYFNVYGPRQNPDSDYAAVIPKFIKSIFAGEQPTIFGDGGQTRDFVFVKDVVRANMLAAETDMSGSYNIGSGISVTINQLAHTIARLAGKSLSPLYREARAGDIRLSEADISNAKAAGYEPKYNLEKGLAETIKWFRQ